MMMRVNPDAGASGRGCDAARCHAARVRSAGGFGAADR
jgi:hypothetical protein